MFVYIQYIHILVKIRFDLDYVQRANRNMSGALLSCFWDLAYNIQFICRCKHQTPNIEQNWSLAIQKVHDRLRMFVCVCVFVRVCPGSRCTQCYY